MTAAAGLAQLQVAPLAASPYNRRDWPHWSDADGDCRDARDEVLIAEAVVAVTLSALGCDVLAGEWIDRYTGQRITDPTQLDVDHLVPLANANASGGAAWSRERKRAYANDLQRGDALVAVTASVNRSKGARSPDAWRPPNRSSWCWYATAWVTVKVTWDLAVTPPERSALSEMLSTC